MNAERQGLAGQELRPLGAVGSEQLDGVDSRLAAAPLLQTGAALGRIGIAGEQLAVAHNRIVRRTVEANTAGLEQDRPVAQPFHGGGVV